MEIGLSSRGEAWKRRGRRSRPIPSVLRDLLESTVNAEEVVRIRGIRSEEDHEEARETVSLARTYARSRGYTLRVQPSNWDRHPSSDDARITSTIAFEMVRPKGNPQ